MANDLTIVSTVSSYSPNLSGTNAPVKTRQGSDELISTQVQSSNQAGYNILTMSEMKRAELSGDYLTLGEEQLVKTIERANKALEGRSTSFEFSIHQKTKQISIKVLDKDTGEIIREIPPEKTLDMVAKMWEMAGLLVDERR